MNLDFIEANSLSWIDNLITSSGKALDDPGTLTTTSPTSKMAPRTSACRKVEANALVVNPEAGRGLCLKAITKYVDIDSPDEYQSGLELVRQDVRRELNRMVAFDLAEGGE